MPTGYAAVLVDRDPPSLGRMIDNIRAFTNDVEVVVFNGGTDRRLTDGFDVAVCPASRPLRYGKVAEFHLEVLHWLDALGEPYEFVVTIETDMALLRPGLEELVVGALRQQDADYLGAQLWERPAHRLPLGMTERAWARVWQPLLDVERPWGAFNPGQVFAREYAQRLARWPRLGELAQRLERTSFHAMEELVWCTLTETLGCRRGYAPWSDAISLEPHPRAALREFAASGQNLLVHKVSRDADAPDRRIVTALVNGEEPDWDAFDDSYAQPATKRRLATRFGFLRQRFAMLGRSE